LNKSLNERDDYNPFTDNAYFNKFAIKYNDNLKAVFEEVDKANNNDKFTKEILPFMEQYSEIRKIRQEQEKPEKLDPPIEEV
jgi:hypothetical protein